MRWFVLPLFLPDHVTPFKAVIAAGSHLFPSRTEKLSPLAPMVLHTRGRVGSRHFYEKPWNSAMSFGAYFVKAGSNSPTFSSIFLGHYNNKVYLCSTIAILTNYTY